MVNLAFASIKELRQKLEKKEVSKQEIAQFFYGRCKQLDSNVKSILELFDPQEEMKKSASEGALAGIPGLVKDTICQEGHITACASKILANYKATYDATAVSRLKQAGAYSLGRANCDEFAMGSSTETSAFQKTTNPWDTSRVPGGSSGGSIAAVAAGLVPWALGTETGGSVRQPAAYCGIVGSKPTYGLVSRKGLVAYASSLDQIGIATRTVYDNALVMSVIAGTDAGDSSTRQNIANLDLTKNLNGSLPANITIGVIDNALYAEGMDSEVSMLLEAVLNEYAAMGAKIKHITLPAMDYGAAVYFMISRAEAASNLARFDGVRYGNRVQAESLADMYSDTRTEGFGEEVKRRILIGNYVLSAGHAARYYESAKKVQALMRAQFLDAFKECDVLFAPVSPTAAFKFGAFDDNRLAMDLQDYFTAAANLTGIPALSIPCGFTRDTLPVGFQLMGPDLAESLLYQIAYAYEQRTRWFERTPKNF
jgi:aspartyl-tRNA(Asn)/glutamyl-tRNA(Gln) amidotransferase subunit A